MPRLLPALLCALLMPTLCESAQAAAPPFQLTDASGSDCALNSRVYDKVLKRSQIYAKGRLVADRHAVPFIDDMCDMGAISLGINGEILRLRPESEDKPLHKGGWYGNQAARVSVIYGPVIYSRYEKESDCTDQWRQVTVHILYKGMPRTVRGTVSGSCP